MTCSLFDRYFIDLLNSNAQTESVFIERAHNILETGKDSTLLTAYSVLKQITANSFSVGVVIISDNHNE